MSENPNSSMDPPKTSPIASRFTRGFLRALLRINRSSAPQQLRRGRRIRVAADASMAFAVGPRRAWSRAVLSRTRTRHAGSARTRVPGPRIRRTARVRSRTRTRNTKELQKLVPGGEAMDVCSLLDETAHYIECLTTQVQVMRTIATLFSSSSPS